MTKPFALLAAALLVPSALAISPSTAASALAAPTAEAEAALEARLLAELQKIEAAQSEDFYPAAKLVVGATGDPTGFRPLMEKLSAKGSAAATCWLAPVLLSELMVEQADIATDSRAVELRRRILEAADRQGTKYHTALTLAAQVTGMGLGAATEDRELAMRYLTEASKLGSQAARTGYLLVSGRLQKGGLKDAAVASELKKNNVALFEYLAQSMGDTPQGVEWLKKASEHGSALAPYLLSQWRSSNTDIEKGKAYLELAVERHYPEAMAFLASLKLNARALAAHGKVPFEEDIAGGRALMELSAALGYPEAAQRLATSMAQGIFGTPDAALVCRLFRMAAAQGDPNGMAGYGYCLLTGRGCEQDATKGLELLLKGTEKGAQWGHQALASAYFNGFGVTADLPAAVGELWEDASMGSVYADAIIAALYALGNATSDPDPVRARTCLDMAVRSHPEAQQIYDEIVAAKGWVFFSNLW